MARPRIHDHAAPRAVDSSRPVTIDADKLERFGTEPLVIFSGNVIARHDSSVQYADRMEVYLDEKGDRIRRIVSTGTVRIVMRHGGEARARRAEYYDLRQRVVLRGDVRAWQGDNFVGGECIVIDLRRWTIVPCLDAGELHTQAPAESEGALAARAAG